LIVNAAANDKALPAGHGAFGPNSVIHDRYTQDVIAEIRRRTPPGR
jgi:hypothetical protein